MRIHTKGEAWVTMPKPTGDRPNIVPARDELCRREMRKRMEMRVHGSVLGDTACEPSKHSRPDGLNPSRVPAEHEGVFGNLQIETGCLVADLRSIRSENLQGEVVECNPSHLMRLGCLLAPAAPLLLINRLRNGESAPFPVHIGPPKSAQFTSSSTRRRTEQKQYRKGVIGLLCLSEEGSNCLSIWSLDLRGVGRGRCSPPSDVLGNHVPAFCLMQSGADQCMDPANRGRLVALCGQLGVEAIKMASIQLRELDVT